jgi:hypothetical protein
VAAGGEAKDGQAIVKIKILSSVWEGFDSLQRVRSRSWNLRSCVLWLHILAGKVVALPSHMLQYRATSLFKCLVGLQQELPKKQKPVLCQICLTISK